MISSRRERAAHDLLAKLERDATVVAWGEPVADAVVVNATPIGMRGESLEGSQLALARGLFDMTYGSEESPAARLMSERGLPIADGRLMLLHQAAAGFELWTGRSAPLAEMRAAVA
jgi:shikimate dehydrogenase